MIFEEIQFEAPTSPLFPNLSFVENKKNEKMLQMNSPGKVKLSAAMRFVSTEREKMKMTRQTKENDKLGIRREMFINYNYKYRKKVTTGVRVFFHFRHEHKNRF
jgi:hypothetical protein